MLSAEEFLGDWSLERLIDDHRTGETNTLHGSATIAEQGGQFVYFETGQLKLATGQELNAERKYTWVFEDRLVQVSFDDGRPFHHFSPSGLAEGTDHLCGADLYKVIYDFTAWPVWSTEWQVQGPKKDYRSKTRYQRG